jgi:hypothetical protein
VGVGSSDTETHEQGDEDKSIFYSELNAFHEKRLDDIREVFAERAGSDARLFI